MIRRIAGVAFAAVIAIALIIVVQMIGHTLYPLPPGIDEGLDKVVGIAFILQGTSL